MLAPKCGILRRKLVYDYIQSQDNKHEDKAQKQETLRLSATNTDLVHLKTNGANPDILNLGTMFSYLPFNHIIYFYMNNGQHHQ